MNLIRKSEKDLRPLSVPRAAGDPVGLTRVGQESDQAELDRGQLLRERELDGRGSAHDFRGLARM